MATGNDAWMEVSDGFRSGMEHVRYQLLGALESHEVRRFGRVGEKFDPQLHEAVQEVDDTVGEQGGWQMKALMKAIGFCVLHKL